MISATGLAEVVMREARHAADFAELTEVCLGAWPGWLHDVLTSHEDADARRLRVSAANGTMRITTDRRLPLAHPLDGDWRFTRACASRILDILLAQTPAGRDMLLIAMPSVALAAYDRGLSERIVVASRSDDPIDQALRAVMPSVRFESVGWPSHRAFATVAVDPPWYDDIAVGLVGMARSHAASTGSVFVCIPDKFTLPSAAPRLSSLDNAPEELGFAHSSIIERVRYATPLFEARSLEALGIMNVSPSWRTGLLLRSLPERAPMGPIPQAARSKNVWREISLDSIRVWLHKGPRTAPIANRTAAVATSVSRRDPWRDAANLWTSGNTVASNTRLATPSSVRAALLGKLNDHWHEALAAALKVELDDVKRVVDFG